PRDEARRLLEQVGLGGRTDHYPAQLSGGEQQRVALARAFINRPQILFADEPTGNLDADTGGRVIESLFELNRAHGTALVLVTHDLELAGRARRIIRLRGGAVVEDTGQDAAECDGENGADVKFQVPGSKLQRSSRLQAPSLRAAGAVELERWSFFGACEPVTGSFRP
ncbi:MAG TPA: ATP-binding cassette domain-containing protein, partial [Verrucomicrobiota bacterium]|nr:ATP-binding cassette domain-containing protein [Verrucomicrobiota bacterium]